jgi:hypothetical protein
VFGVRYKSILVERENCFRALLDNTYLNRVRAGLVNAGNETAGRRRYRALAKSEPTEE